MQQFARLTGVAFQIIDDVNNFSESKDWTKTVGEDLATGKMTFVLWHAIRDSPDDQSTRLQDLLVDPERRVDPVELQAGIDLVRESGTLDVANKPTKCLIRGGTGFAGTHRNRTVAIAFSGCVCGFTPDWRVSDLHHQPDYGIGSSLIAS